MKSDSGKGAGSTCLTLSRQQAGEKLARPLLLGVETSSPIFSVAIWRGGRQVGFLQADGTARPSVLLAGMIQDCLTQAKGKLTDLDGIALSIGPGSFTGLRVGVATVKTLAWALKVPILPISSLEVIAFNAKENPHPILPFLDARKGKVYTALFSPDGKGGLDRRKEDRLMLPEEALKGIPLPCVLLGDGIKRYADRLFLFKEKIVFASESQWVPSAEALCRIALYRWPSGVVDDPHRLVPHYLYSQESDITGW